MDKMREEFESWIAVYMPGYELEYSGWIEAMFDAWQASRQALVVQLPLWRHYNGVQAYDMNEVKQSIEDSGIKWKS